jgi:hypothetical protein
MPKKSLGKFHARKKLYEGSKWPFTEISSFKSSKPRLQGFMISISGVYD